MAAEFRLHCFPESGGCYKAALMLALCGAEWEGVFVDYFAGETRSPGWRARVSVMGEVPVLEHAGKRLTQSGVILSHLSRRFGRFAAEDGDEQLRWLLFDNHKFTSYLSTWRWMLGWTENPEPAVLAFLRGRIETAFGVVEAQLADGRAFLLGDEPCVADVSMQGYLHYPESEWPLDHAARFPRIAAWRARFAAMPGHAPPYDLLPGARTPPRL